MIKTPCQHDVDWGQLDAQERRELNEKRRPFQQQLALEQRRVQKLDGEIRVLNDRLDNRHFRERAPGPVVEDTAQRLEDAFASRKVVKERLASLRAADLQRVARNASLKADLVRVSQLRYPPAHGLALLRVVRRHVGRETRGSGAVSLRAVTFPSLS